MLDVIALHPRLHPDQVGFIPSFLDEDDPRMAAEQLDAHYVGGWHPQDGFTRSKGGEGFTLHYPGDPPMQPIAAMKLREELILVYEYGYVGIFRANGTFEVARCD